MSRIDQNTSIEDLAVLVSQALATAGIDAVLSGGAVVSIYTRNEYESGDLDFISTADTGRIATAMNALGFEREGRMFTHPHTNLFVEFPPGPLAIGEELIRSTEVEVRKTAKGTIRLLTPTQCVMDRLAAYFHWGDLQSLDQALMVSKKQKIHLTKIEVWAKREGMLEKFEEFRTKLSIGYRKG